jgi:hypothetical protein
MNIRVRCQACQTTYLVPEEHVGKRVGCPKCGARQVAIAPSSAPASKAAVPESRKPAPQPAKAEIKKVVVASQAPTTTEESVFVPSGEDLKRHRFRPLAWASLALLAAAGMGVVVAWPAIRDWWNPVPPDPVESVARAFLDSLIKKDSETTKRLSTLEIPPGIRSVRSVKRDRTRDSSNKGSFAPIAAFHAKLNETHAFDRESGRYIPKNALGPAAETLDALHDAKAKAEQEGLYKKMQSGNPDDLFDAAEGLGKTFAALAEGALAPKKLIPSYKQLVEDAKPPLPDNERALVLDYDSRRDTWDALLKRPFSTLQADGPYLLERSQVSASVIDSLASSGDPPTSLHLTLTRFRLEGIDTGWKVTASRRRDAPVQPAEERETPKTSEKASPGEAVKGQPDAPPQPSPRNYDRPGA